MSGSLNFPTSPDAGALSTNGQQLRYDGTKWIRLPSPGGARLTALNDGPLSGFRNQLMNPDFRINQRGAGAVTTDQQFPVDRWWVASVGGSRSASRVALTDSDRAAIGREDALWCMQYQCTGGSNSTDYTMLVQAIDGIFSLANQWVTLSFWARRTAGSGDIATDFGQYHGDGVAAINVGIGAKRHSLSTSWQKFTSTFFMPMPVDSALGSTPDWTRLYIWLSSGSSFNQRNLSLGVQTLTVQIADVQLEPGMVATAFECRPVQIETQMCQRYCCVLDCSVQAGAVGNQITMINFPTPMRYAPSATLLAAGTPYGIDPAQTLISVRDAYGALFQIYATLIFGSITYQRYVFSADIY